MSYYDRSIIILYYHTIGIAAGIDGDLKICGGILKPKDLMG